MAETVGLSREDLFSIFGEARAELCGPEIDSELANSHQIFESEELNEAMRLIQLNIAALIEVIDENNQAIANDLKRR